MDNNSSKDLGGETTPAVSPRGRIAHIDGLRAIAVLLVVFAHAGLGNVIPGGSGVTIFFTVSGFIITYLLLRELDEKNYFDVGGFYFRRAAKIFPPFALIIIVPTVIWSFLGQLNWWDFATQIFFIFNWTYIPGHVEVLPGSAVVWSLAVEEQFYISFALIWLIVIRLRSWRLALVLLSISAIIWATATRLFLVLEQGTERRIYFGTDTRMDAIAFGVLAAILIHEWIRLGNANKSLSRVLGSDLIFISAILFFLISLFIRDEWFRGTFRYSFQAIATCAILIYGFFPGESPLKRAFLAVCGWKPVALLGLASYSIYLVHLILDIALFPLIESWPLGARVLILVISGVALGISCYFLIEIPVQTWRQSSKEKISLEK